LPIFLPIFRLFFAYSCRIHAPFSPVDCAHNSGFPNLGLFPEYGDIPSCIWRCFILNSGILHPAFGAGSSRIWRFLARQIIIFQWLIHSQNLLKLYHYYSKHLKDITHLSSRHRFHIVAQNNGKLDIQSLEKLRKV
jgi:hypothetical protein